MKANPHNTGRRQFLTALGATSAAPSTASSQAAAPGKKINVGLIGCGNRGSYLASAAKELGKQGEPVDVVAVCDIYQPRLERLSTKLSARYYKDSRELVGDREVNAVIVATPDRLHAYHALEAVRAGKDVYSEKPATHWQQFALLKELVREVRAAKAVYQMGTQRLSDPIWRQTEAMIRRGDIGKPMHAQMGYFRLGDSGERGMPIDDPNAQPGPDLNWKAFLADAPDRPFDVSRFFQWRMYLDYSGGPCTDNDVHFLALIIKALGAGFPRKAVALGGRYVYSGAREVPDTFDMVFEYPEGLNLTFLGTYGNDSGMETIIRGSEGTWTLPKAEATAEPLARSGKPRREFGRIDVNREHLRDFLHCVQTRQQPQGSIELAYRTQVALIMAMRAFMESKVAYFDPDKEEIRLL